MDKDRDKERIRPSRRKTVETHDGLQQEIPQSNEVDLLDQQEQERVQEGLSISVPVAPLPKRAKPFWSRYLGSKVFLLLKDGSEIGGILRELLWDFIKVDNFLEVGPSRRGSASWVLVDTASVSRIYAADVQFEHSA